MPAADDDRAQPATPRVEIRRSARRRTTVTARREGDTVVVLVPARLSAGEAQRWADRMVERLATRERRVRRTDDELLERAAQLSRRHFDGAARPASVSWSSQQRSRWGSCSVADRTIRISDRLRGFPVWVQDYVLVHELAHLLEADHSPRFWQLVGRYPQAERARGFLEGASHAARVGAAGGGADDPAAGGGAADNPAAGGGAAEDPEPDPVGPC